MEGVNVRMTSKIFFASSSILVTHTNVAFQFVCFCLEFNYGQKQTENVTMRYEIMKYDSISSSFHITLFYLPLHCYLLRYPELQTSSTSESR